MSFRILKRADLVLSLKYKNSRSGFWKAFVWNHDILLYRISLLKALPLLRTAGSLNCVQIDKTGRFSTLCLYTRDFRGTARVSDLYLHSSYVMSKTILFTIGRIYSLIRRTHPVFALMLSGYLSWIVHTSLILTRELLSLQHYKPFYL